MAFTYNASSPGDRDKVRLLISDTSSTDYVYEDAELDIFLDLNSDDIRLAAVQALRTLAANKAKFAHYYQIHGSQFSMDRRQVHKALLDVAAAIEKQATSEPFEFESHFEQWIDSAGRDLSNYLDTPSDGT